MLNKQLVLDHGYVAFVEAWGHGEECPLGSDDYKPTQEKEAGIIEAARQSTQGSFRGWEQGDQKLLDHLFNSRPQHAGPFEFAGMIIEVQAPIFVFREWHRHRSQSYNEMSARYAPLPDLNYIPSLERLMMNASKTNKQAGTIKDAKQLTREEAVRFQNLLGQHYTDLEITYQNALESGVPKELARVCLPLGRYSRMRAAANLRNWLAFMTLRADPAAQWEIQQFAKEVGVIIDKTFPRVWALFDAARHANR